MRNTICLFILALFIVSSCNDKGNGTNNQNKDEKSITSEKEINTTKLEDDYKNTDEDIGNSNHTMLGRWRFVDIGLPGLKKPTPEQLEKMRSNYIEFKGDGSYIATTKVPVGEDEKEYGTYQFDANAKTLSTLTKAKNDQESFTVEFRGRNTVILTFKEGKIIMERDE